MDISLHYDEQGSGEPLILLHGNGEDSSYFERQIPYLAEHFRVIAVDTRGHGQSPRGRALFTLDQFALDLAHFMDGRGVPAAHLLGFSDGANVALLFALAHPGRVLSLVLNGGNLFPEGLAPEVREDDARAWEKASAAGDKQTLDLLRLMMEEPHIDPASLSTIAVPTLVIAGNRDMILEDHTRLIAESIPGSTLRIIEGTHFVAAERPQAFNAELGRFYDSFTRS